MIGGHPQPQYNALRPCEVSSLGLPYVDCAFGLFPNIFSISSKISGVNFGTTSSAFRLSSTCSGLLAPNRIVLVFGFLASHANAKCVIVHPNFVSASEVSDFTLAIWSFPSGELSFSIVDLKKVALVVKRESLGIPSLYWRIFDIRCGILRLRKRY